MSALKSGDALVVYSLSRLSRSTRDTLEIADTIAKKDADLVSISEKIDTTSAAGKMVFRLMAVMNEFERDQVSERTKAALDLKKEKGERTGSIPYGYNLAKDGKKLVANPLEQSVIAQAKELSNSGLSLRKIATELAKRGFTSRKGTTFQATQINRILKNAS